MMKRYGTLALVVFSVAAVVAACSSSDRTFADGSDGGNGKNGNNGSQNYTLEDGACFKLLPDGAIQDCEGNLVSRKDGGGTDGITDCDGDGKEDRLGTDENCSACGDECFAADGTGKCVDGECQVGSCNDGYDDCDGDYENGCEANLDSTETCGSCDIDCGGVDDGGVGAVCTLGVCQIAGCPDGYDDCNNDYSDGCETPLNTLDDCGKCGVACARDNATATCESGICEIDVCDDGWGDCDTDPQNGCERDTDTSLGHCGGCDKPCDFANASEECVGGVCNPLGCDPNWDDCVNGMGDGRGNGDGCETDLKGDVQDANNILHCGSCNNDCTSNTSAQICVDNGSSYVCQDNGCNAGLYDTDGNGSCECSIDEGSQNASACGQIPETITVNPGATVVKNANIPDNVPDWYAFSFPNTNTRGNRFEKEIEIILTGASAGTYVMEIHEGSSCTAGNAATNCVNGSKATEWSWEDPCTTTSGDPFPADPDPVKCTNLIATGDGLYKAAPTQVKVKVYRDGANTCTPYTLTVRRGAVMTNGKGT